jgi:nucleoside-diphosphate-sugar epimerase
MTIIQRDIFNIISSTNLNFLKGKEILITGASGSVGTYFASALEEIQKNGEGPSKIFLSSKTGEFQFVTALTTEIIAGDLSSSKLLNSLPEVDIIIHAAGYGQPQKFLEDPLLTINLNTAVTLELVNKVRTSGKFLFISSSEVYSGLNNPPFKEDQIGTTNTNHLRSAYIESKRTGEAITSNINKRKRISAKSTRLSLAYGPGTKLGDSKVINSFIHQAISSSKISLKDAGNAWRTYCYISDAIEMCFRVLDRGTDDIYNVAGNSRVKIIELAKLISELTGCELDIPESDDHSLSGAPDDVWLDLSKTLSLAKKLDFISLHEGLRRTLEWQKLNLF